MFKVRIGLASEDRDQFERLLDEIDRAMTDGGTSREETIRKNNMELFARKFFQPNSPPLQYNQQPLRRPLLAKNNDIEKRVGVSVAMQLFAKSEFWKLLNEFFFRANFHDDVPDHVTTYRSLLIQFVQEILMNLIEFKTGRLSLANCPRAT